MGTIKPQQAPTPRPFARMTGQLWRGRYFVLSILVAGVMCYGLVWFMFWRASVRAVEHMGQALGRQVQVETVLIRPQLRVDMENVRIWDTGHGRGRPALRAQRVSVWPDLLAAFTGRVRFRRVEIWSPVVEISPDPDGTVDYSVWRRAGALKPHRDFERIFPSEIVIHDGAVQAHVVPWQDTAGAYFTVDGISGKLGLTKNHGVGMALEGMVYGAPVTLQGTVFPGKKDMFGLKVVCESFDYASMAETVNQGAAGGKAQLQDLPVGTGRLVLEVGGDITHPIVRGSAELRDVDAEFSTDGRRAHVYNLRAGPPQQRMNGRATVNFMEPDLPFTLEIDLKKVDLSEMLSPAMGYRLAPEGELSGVVRISSQLTDLENYYIDGEITVGRGAFYIPIVRIGSQRAPYCDISTLPFESLSAHFEVLDRQLTFNQVDMQGSGYGISGTATIDTVPELFSNFEQGFEYSLNLSIASDDLSDTQDVLPEFLSYIDGTLKGNLWFIGDLREPGSASGAGTFVFHDGLLSNPYTKIYEGLDQDINFKSLEASFRLEEGVLQLAGLLADRGLHFTWEGDVDLFGEIDIRGEVAASRAAAAGFAGLADRVTARPDADGMRTIYKADVTVDGPIYEPRTRWSLRSSRRRKMTAREYREYFEELAEEVREARREP